MLAYNVRRRHEGPGRGRIRSNLVDGTAVGGSGFSSIEELNRVHQSQLGLLLRARRSVKAVADMEQRYSRPRPRPGPVTPILRDHKKRDQDGLRIIKHNAGEA